MIFFLFAVATIDERMLRLKAAEIFQALAVPFDGEPGTAIEYQGQAAYRYLRSGQLLILNGSGEILDQKRVTSHCFDDE